MIGKHYGKSLSVCEGVCVCLCVFIIHVRVCVVFVFSVPIAFGSIINLTGQEQ